MEEEKKTPEREEEQALPVQELPTDIPAEVRQKLAEDLNEQATEDLKLFLPARLKLELQNLADAAKQPLSDYLRAVLARHLLGERFFREWQAALAKANAEAARHESDIVLSR